MRLIKIFRARHGIESRWRCSVARLDLGENPSETNFRMF